MTYYHYRPISLQEHGIFLEIPRLPAKTKLKLKILTNEFIKSIVVIETIKESDYESIRARHHVLAAIKTMLQD